MRNLLFFFLLFLPATTLAPNADLSHLKRQAVVPSWHHFAQRMLGKRVSFQEQLPYTLSRPRMLTPARSSALLGVITFLHSSSSPALRAPLRDLHNTFRTSFTNYVEQTTATEEEKSTVLTCFSTLFDYQNKKDCYPFRPLLLAWITRLFMIKGHYHAAQQPYELTTLMEHLEYKLLEQHNTLAVTLFDATVIRRFITATHIIVLFPLPQGLMLSLFKTIARSIMRLCLFIIDLPLHTLSVPIRMFKWFLRLIGFSPKTAQQPVDELYRWLTIPWRIVATFATIAGIYFFRKISPQAIARFVDKIVIQPVSNATENYDTAGNVALVFAERIAKAPLRILTRVSQELGQRTGLEIATRFANALKGRENRVRERNAQEACEQAINNHGPAFTRAYKALQRKNVDDFKRAIEQYYKYKRKK